MDTILITGASGYLGSLVAAALAADSLVRLVLLIRNHRDSTSVVARIIEEAALIDPIQMADAASRITVIAMPDPFTSADVVKAVQQFNITEILHCAGSLSYWNLEKLHAGNAQLTRELLDAGKRLGVRRFIHLSSAFCSGYVDTIAREQLHSSPGSDPCPYTSSKRDSETIVATSGLPYVIVRPSIVIGDSRDGRYTGKLSGLYQFWWAAQRYLFGRTSVIHVACPDVPLHVVHQDAFQAGFVGTYKYSPDNSIIHLVSRDETLPTVRQLWNAAMVRYAPNSEVHYYDDVESIPMEECDDKMQQLLSAVRTNMEICSHRWHFESTSLEHLRSKGVIFADATLATVKMAQDRFLSPSEQAYEFSG